MNGGSAEAEQVGRIKRMAEMNYRARRRGVRVPGVVGGMDWEAGQPLMMAGSEEAVKQNWDLGAGAGQQEVMVWEAGGEGDLEGKFVGDFSMSSAVGGRRLSLRKKGAVRDEMGGKGMGLSSVKSGSQVCRPPTSSFGSPGCASQAPFSAFSASQAAASRRLQSPRTLNSIWWHSGFADSYHVRNNQELGLLMHYLDNVFCLQFGFICLKRSQPVLDRGRGWYLNTLLRCQPLYFATLSISAYHQHLMKAGNLAASWAPSGGKPSGEVAKVALNWDAEKNLLMTLNGLQEVIDNFQGQGLKGLELLKEWWQVLGTMCQVLSLEV
jgi:hypothetical protein